MNRWTSSKPLLLVFPYDAMAHYLRCLRLATYFRPWFQVEVLYSTRYYPFISEAGFTTFECATLDVDKVQPGVQAFDFSWLNEKDLFYIYKQQVKLLNERRPTWVIGDMAPTLKMATEKTRVNYISLFNAYMSRYYAYPRKMPRSHPLYTFFKILPEPWFNYLSTTGECLYFKKLHLPFSNIRQKEGLTQKHSYLQELEGDLNLLPDLEELFSQKNLPENYLFIPPLFHPPRDNDTILSSQFDTNKKTILVSMGSTGNWHQVAFLNQSHYRQYNIITAGDKDRMVKGSHVSAFPFITNQPLFEKTDLVICHGGNGTCYQALSFGIPVLCYTAHLEQEYNMDSLERYGLGKCLNTVSPQHYPIIIHEWMHKKQDRSFMGIRKKISEEVNRTEEIIQSVILNKLRYYPVNGYPA